MDTNQIARMIEWLDEERRRDKQTIAKLEERLAQQSDTIDKLQRRVNGVESDQTVMREATLPAEKERELMERARREMREMLDNTEYRRKNAEREAEKRQEISRESIMRTVRDLQEQVDKLRRNRTSISEVKTEGDRTSDSVVVLQQRIDDLARQLEEPDRRLSFLEEQRRQDARRISELESELPEMRKQIDSIRPKMSLLEDLSLRNERRVQEVQNAERERRDQIQQFIDSQQLQVQQQQQKIDDIIKRFGKYDEEMEKNLERFETWASAYRDMKRIIDDFERIGDRLERRINEVAEMQRLSEERFRQEWDEWRDDDQKRWKQLTLSNDEVWRNHDKEFEQYISRLEDVQSTVEPLQDSLRRLWSLERERAELYRERYQSLLLEYDTGTSPSSTSSSATGSSSNGGGSL
jgi:chromosome segregation ATPase